MRISRSTAVLYSIRIAGALAVTLPGILAVAPAHAAVIGWAVNADGSFNTAADWSPAIVPGAADDATIATASAHTVTSSTTNTVNTLATGANSTLAITAGTFTISNGTGTGANAGTISVGDNTALVVRGTVKNTGSITVNSAGGTTDLRAADGTVFTGGGGIAFSDNANNRFFGAANNALETVTNFNDTITGAGQFGISNSIEFINQAAGVVNANAANNALVISPLTNPAITGPNGGGFVNQGLLEATNTGGLILNGGQYNNKGGTIQAVGAGDNVTLRGSAIVSGGVLTTSGGGLVQTGGGNTASLDGVSQSQLTNSGTYLGNDNSSTNLSGAIFNSGTLSVHSTGSTTDLRAANGTTLTGGGTIQFSDNANNRFFGVANNATEVVTNVDNTFKGAGQFGTSNSIEFINKSAGVVNADGTAALVLAPTTDATTVTAHGGGFVNQGLLEATNTGGLTLTNGQYNNAGGTIQAVGAGNNVTLTNGATVSGGALTGSGGGLLQTAIGNTAHLDGASQGQITLSGTYLGNNNSTTTLSGTIDNTGTISVNSAGSTTDLHAADGTKLTGGGQIVFSDNANNRFFGVLNSGVETVTNVNNTISGAGQFGVSNSFEFINQSLINANAATNALVLSPTTQGAVVTPNGGGFVNQGTLEATGNGGLVLSGGQFNNKTGTIKAVGAGHDVTLVSTTVSGGLLAASGGGLIETRTGFAATLDGTSQGQITLSGTYQMTNNSTTNLVGTINNTGTIALNSTGGTTDLHVADGTTLTGGGQLVFSDNANNRFFGTQNSGVETVTNVNNTITGAGQLGVSNSIEFLNQAAGVINANGANALIISPTTQGAVVTPNGGGFVNQGLLEATGSGGLILSGGQFNNAGGTIQSVNAGNNVTLRSAAVVSGGLLTTSGGGLILTAAGHSATLDGTSDGVLTNAGTYQGTDNSTTFLDGAIHNTGTISLNSLGSTTDLRVADGTHLTGGGTVRLSDNANNRIWGLVNSGTETLTNVDNTITGAGQFGISNGLAVVNGGVIDASGANALIVTPTVGIIPGLLNQAGGVLRGSGAGGLRIIQGTTTNQGTIEALDGSSVTFSPSAVLSNNSAGTLTGGIYRAVSTGGGATVSITGGPVVTDAADIVLSGAGSVFQAGSGGVFTPLETSLTTIAGAGALHVLNNRNYTTPNTIANGGLIDLGGGVFTANSTSNTATGTLSGFGTVANSNGTPFANAGLVEAKGGTLVLPKGIAGTSASTTQIDASAGLDLSGATTGGTTGTLTHNGASLNLGGQNITVSQDYTNASFGVGNSFNNHANVTGTGKILAAGNVGLSVTGAGITGGTSATPTLALGNIHVGGTSSTVFDINNTGSTGPVLRGAVQNAGISTGGLGVTALNFGPIALGGSTAETVTFAPGSAGALTGQSFAVVTNFDNVAGKTIGVTGTAYRLAQANTIAGLNFGSVHQNATASQALSVSNLAAADGFSEKLDAQFGGTSDARILTSGSIATLAAGATDSSSLVVSLDTSHTGTINGTATVLLQSDGAGTSGLGKTALATQTPGVLATITSGSVFGLASASPHTPEPVNFGNVRINSAVANQSLSLTNTAPNDGFHEKLDAQIGSAAGAATTNGGSFLLLAPQSTDSASLQVGLNTAAAGAVTGTAVIALQSDGAGTSGLGITPLPSQTVNVQANVFRLANPTLNTPSLTLAARVGDTSPTAAISVTNTSPDAFTEGLKVSLGGAPAGFTSAGAIGNLAAGATDASSLRAGLNTATSGIFTGAAAVGFTSTGAGTDNAADLALPGGSVALTGKVYTTAIASVAPNPVNFGIVHVGDAVGPRALTIANTAVGALTDTLTGGFGMVGGPFSGTGALAGVAAGGSDATSLKIGLNTSTAGVFGGTANLSLKSHDADLADIGVSTGPITLSAQVNNYANAVFLKQSGAGTFSGGGLSYLLNFGNVLLGTPIQMAGLGVENLVTGPSDFLSGVFSTIGSGLSLSGFNPFTNLAAGGVAGGLSVDLNPISSGFFDVFVTLDPTGSNASGYAAALPNVTLELRANVVGIAPVPEPGSLALFASALAGLLTFRRRRAMA